MMIEDDFLRAFVKYVLQQKLMELEKEGADRAFKKDEDPEGNDDEK